MPRLSVWFLGSTTTIATAYLGYKRVYEPYHNAQRVSDRLLESSKQPYQDAAHAFAQLAASLDQHQATLQVSQSVHCKSPDAVARRRSAWFTNAEKIIFFCQLQQLRAQLWALPIHLTTWSDRQQTLRQMEEWEATHCTELFFRDEPLTLRQMGSCLVCYVLYVMTFRVLPTLLRWPEANPRRCQLQHRVAALITRSLGIDVTMTREKNDDDQRFRSHVTDIRGPHAMDSDTVNEIMPPSDTRPVRYLLLNMTHWIEEVGFWACSSNPLILPSTSGVTAPPDAAALHLLEGQAFIIPDAAPSWMTTIFLSPLWTFPSASATAFTTTYTQHWGQVVAQHKTMEVAMAAQGRLSKSEVSRDVPPVADTAASDNFSAEVSLGYPLLSNVSALQKMEVAASNGGSGGDTPLWVPVAAHGLPSVLFIDAAHGQLDVRPRTSRHETFTRLHEAQYPLARHPTTPPISTTVHSAEKGGKEASEMLPGQLSGDAAPPSAATGLQHWRLQNGFRWWSPLWWGRVYGGPSRSGNRCRRSLHYHIGQQTTSKDYASEAAKTSQRAAELSAASRGL